MHTNSIIMTKFAGKKIPDFYENLLYNPNHTDNDTDVDGVLWLQQVV